MEIDPDALPNDPIALQQMLRELYAENDKLRLLIGKRVGTNTLRRDAGVCWTWDMDMPDLPVIETQDTHKIGRKGVGAHGSRCATARVQRQSRWMSATIRMDDAGFGRRLGLARP